VLDKAEYSTFQSTLNSSIVSYRIVTLVLKLRLVSWLRANKTEIGEDTDSAQTLKSYVPEEIP